MNTPSRKLPFLILNLGLLFCGALLIWFSPAEKTLGSLVKLVYAHGALIYSALFSFLASGCIAAAYVISSNKKAYRWFRGFQRTAFLFWSVYFLSSIVLTYLAWGAVGWGEPRFQLAVQILGLIAVVLIASIWLENPRRRAYLGMCLSFYILARTWTVATIFHPNNPIGQSDSPLMKIYALMILLVFLLVSLITAYLLLPRSDDSII